MHIGNLSKSSSEIPRRGRWTRFLSVMWMDSQKGSLFRALSRWSTRSKPGTHVGCSTHGNDWSFGLLAQLRVSLLKKWTVTTCYLWSEPCCSSRHSTSTRRHKWSTISKPCVAYLINSIVFSQRILYMALLRLTTVVWVRWKNYTPRFGTRNGREATALGAWLRWPAWLGVGRACQVNREKGPTISGHQSCGDWIQQDCHCEEVAHRPCKEEDHHQPHALSRRGYDNFGRALRPTQT